MVKIKNKIFMRGAPKFFGGRCTRSCTLHHSGSVLWKNVKNELLPTVNYNNHSMFIIIKRDTVRSCI